MHPSPFIKDVEVYETDRYILVKIPRRVKKAPRRQRANFADLAGALKDIPEFQGKSSVEVQHMFTRLWREQTLKPTNS